jgi:hypothetical protein
MAPPDPPFELTKLAGRLHDRALPLGEGEELRGFAYSILCEALLSAGVELAEGFDPDAPHYPVGVLMTYNAPAWALPWAAQVVGLTLGPGLSEEQGRDLMRDAPNWKRGTTATMEALAGLYLTGDKTIFFRERDGDPYYLEVVTRAGETPDPELVRKALEAAKPVGLILHYRTTAGWDYQELKASGPDPYSALRAAYATYRALSDGPH